MAILKMKEIREMDDASLDRRTKELREQLNVDLGSVAGGGKAQNPGRIKEIKKTIARILTVKNERAGLARGKAS
ncbi:50S ribosomal protein L29 [uncultured archaeon]|nr:50S ribosomal protein L29 [uncultured archaeon]